MKFKLNKLTLSQDVLQPVSCFSNEKLNFSKKEMATLSNVYSSSQKYVKELSKITRGYAFFS